MCCLKKMCYIQIILYVVGAFGYPASDSNPNTSEDDNCIQMTTDNVEKINDLVEKISSFINEISTKYEEIDLRLVEISVDKHSLVENKKNTTIHVTINDCLDGLKRTEYISPDGDHEYKTDNDFNDDKQEVIYNEATSTELNEEENINKSNDANHDDDENNNERDILSDEFSSAEDLAAVENGEDFTDSRDTEINDKPNNENFNDLQDSDKEEESNNFDKSKKFDDFGDDFDVIDDYQDLGNKKDKLSDIDTLDPKQNTQITNDYDYKLIINNNETDDNNYDDLLTKNDETVNKEQDFDSKEFQNEDSVQNNTEIIRFINFNDINVTDNELSSKMSYQEILLLSDEDKLVFKELEKIRGSKPFFLYQRFFNNTSQYWFL